MAEQCRNCGLELFAGQRFCRACGAPSEPISQEQTPTQMMPPQPSEWGARGAANTAPANAQNTSPVYAPPPSGYQPSVPPMYPQTMPPYTPPQKRSPVGWILAFIGMGLFVAVVVAIMLIARAGRNQFGRGSGPPPVPAVPLTGETALESASDQTTVSSGDTTTMLKTFPLTPGSKFSIKNISGSISVEAWDQPKAEVKVVKRGPDRGAQVFFINSANSLSIRTGVPPGNNRQEVRYEIRLPRNMGRIDLESTNGSVKLTDVSGQINVETANGSIELNDVSGVNRIQSANGKITGTLLESSDGPMEFSVANGRIDLTLKSDFAADLEASTVSGNINIDDQFGIQVQKGVVGARARGKIGSGGQPLKITSVNGSIKVSKQE